VKIQTLWLEIDDYPRMVGSADLGICMHLSSSNLDLPMKVVDMFSCQLPCFAYDYPTIGELVTQEVGRLFKDEN
jgi:beta-1,4-mannosyltransferase